VNIKTTQRKQKTKHGSLPCSVTFSLHGPRTLKKACSALAATIF